MSPPVCLFPCLFSGLREHRTLFLHLHSRFSSPWSLCSQMKPLFSHFQFFFEGMPRCPLLAFVLPGSSVSIQYVRLASPRSVYTQIQCLSKMCLCCANLPASLKCRPPPQWCHPERWVVPGGASSPLPAQATHAQGGCGSHCVDEAPLCWSGHAGATRM